MVGWEGTNQLSEQPLQGALQDASEAGQYVVVFHRRKDNSTATSKGAELGRIHREQRLSGGVATWPEVLRQMQ